MKINKSISLLLFIFFSYFKGYAQVNYEDVVYLKNGSIIRGVIIEQVFNVSLKIQTKDRNVFFYKVEEVEKITKEELKDPNVNSSSTTQLGKFQFDKVKSKGYQNILEIGGVFGVANIRYVYESSFNSFNNRNGLNLFSIQDVNSVKLDRITSIGIGVGVEIGRPSNGRFLHLNIPVFADFRFRPLKSRFSPIFIQQLGLSFLPIYSGDVDEQTYYGALLNTKIGLNAFVNNKTSLNLGMGYRFQHYTFVENYRTPRTYHLLYHFLSAFFSIHF